jgi:replicative DNA helicase
LWQRREALKATKQFSISENHQKDISDLILTLNKLNLDEIDEYDHQRSVTETSLYIYDSKKNGRNMLGISSNLETIDKYLNGWQRKKTYVIGGMEKLGKSRFCLELASCWLSKGIGGIEFSLEMSANDIHECIIGNRALIDTAKFGTDNITADELYRMSAKAGTYLNEPLYISTRSSVTLEYIRSVIRRQKIKFKSAGYDVVWVVVDYIQRMVDGDNRAGKLEDVAKGLADIARDEDVIMIPISQLSQEAERDAHPDYSPHRFIKGSKGIREAADVIIVIYKTKEGKHYAYIVQRKGKSNISIPLIPQLEFSRFRDDKAEGGF